MIFTVLRSVSEILNLMFSSYLDWVYGFGGGEHWGKVQIYITLYQRAHTINRIYDDVDCDHLADVMFVRCFHCEVTRHSASFHTVLFGGTSLYVPHT